jgi:3-hydroxybutyryl-CoA dehydrogenase
LLTVAIIGAGPLGRWLAVAAARAGYCVLLEDVMPANLHHAQEYIRRQLGPVQVAEMLFPIESECEEKPAFGLPVVFVSTIEDAVRNADMVIDCVPDELESKLEILWLLDRMAPPRTVLATPTTRLSIIDLAACTYRAEKCVAIVIEASELTAQNAKGCSAEILLRTTPQTTDQTIALLEAFWRRLGFSPRFESERLVSQP